MKCNILIGLALAMLVLSCTETGNEAQAQVAPRDTSINYATSYSGVFFDSLRMERFISLQHFHDSLVKKIRNFYNTRNYQYAWFFKDGIADHASSFYDVYNEYVNYSRDTGLKNQSLQLMYDSISNGNFTFNISDDIVLNTELMLTAQFFRYSRRAYQGNNELDARELDWFIPRKKIDPTALLDSVLYYKGKNLTQLEPVNRQYNLLKNYLLRYYDIQKSGGWAVIIPEKKFFKKGDSAGVILKIKKRLYLLGDLPSIDSSEIFNDSMEVAVKDFQKRNGLKADGIMAASFFNEINR